MTTPAAARLYLAQHLYETEGQPNVIYNPNNLDVEELPLIIGFNNGGSLGWLSAVAMAEDGTFLGSHCCSDEGYMPYDLGIIEGAREDRHEKDYKKHYPDGYRMEFVTYEQVGSHTKLLAALQLNGQKKLEEQSK